MSSSLSVEPRRSPGTRKPPRDLPVLFHLMDVSRRKPAAKTLPAVAAESAELPSDNVALPPAVAAVPEEIPTPPEPTATQTQPHPLGSPPVPDEVISAPPAEPAAVAAPPEFKPLVLPEPPAAPWQIPAAEVAAESQDESPVASQDELPPAVEAGSTTALESEIPPGPPAVTDVAPADVTPRSLAKTAGARDWFTSQGKYIAIAFVIALLGTIVLARLNRRTTPLVVDDQHSHPGEAGHKLAAANVATEATIVGQASQGTAAKATSNLLETSPAQLAETRPQTDLHPPSIPQLAAQGGGGSEAEPAKDESLFPWAKPEERIAALPEPPSSAAPPLETPLAPVSQPAAPQLTASTPAITPAPAPALAPQYPVTSTPEPAFSTTAPAYPTTSTPNQYQYQPVAPAPTTQPASGPALAPPTGGSQYFPQDNSASGSRYERTGSGLY